MATVGLRGDVNNSIYMGAAYPMGGRSYGLPGPSGASFDMKNNYAGELGGLNQDYARSMAMRSPAAATNMAAPATRAANGAGASNGKQPAVWWLTFAIVFIIVAWAARKFAPDGEQFAIVKPNLINGVFLTLYIVLILVFLKQIAIRIKPIPFVSPLADMIMAA